MPGFPARVERFPSNPSHDGAPGRWDDYDPTLVAPPKRKTGSGRVTPKGTKPGGLPTAGAPAPRRKAHSSSDTEHEHHATEASSRYTPKVHKYEKESPRWLPVLMIGLLAIGGILIMLKYLGWVPGGQDGSQLWIVAGLVCVLGGLFTATRWR